jgi:hypothetical protein
MSCQINFHEVPLPSHQHSEEEIRFENWLNNNPKIDEWFYSAIDGISLPNDDGTSRQKYLRHCKPYEPLVLKWCKNNPVDKRAVGVFRETGEQLGYLNSRCAHETLNKTRRGERWTALLVNVGSPAGNPSLLGALIVMARKKEEAAS